MTPGCQPQAKPKATDVVAATPSAATPGPSLAPPFELVDIRGKKVALAKFAGRPVILLFCASWSLPCRTEMRRLQQAYSQHGRAGLVVVGIQEQDSRAEVEAVARELGLTFPVLLDDGQRVYDLFRVQGLPTAIFLDRGGGIRHVQLGALMEETLARALNVIVR